MRVDLVYQTDDLQRDKMIRRRPCKTVKEAKAEFRAIDCRDITKAWIVYFDGLRDVFMGYLKNEGVI